MKKVLLLLIAMLLCASCFVACDGEHSNSPSTDSSDASEKEYVFPEISNKSELADEETKAVLAITDAALKERYSISDLSVYGTNVYKLDDGRISVSYTLYIFGHHTYENYKIRLSPDKEIQDIDAYHYGEYSCYLSVVTKEDFKRAHKAISDQTKEYDEEPHYYLMVDDEGYLCLDTEIIVYLDIPENSEDAGCGIDHDHLFFSERLCAKP